MSAGADAVLAGGTAIAGEDGALLQHTPRFAELLGRAGQDLTGQLLAPLLQQAFQQDVPIDGRPAPAQLRTADGRDVLIDVERLSNGESCVTATDISGVTAIAEALARARRIADTTSRVRSRVLATISHELRTPLNAVIGFADALAEPPQPGGQPIPSERVREYANTIREAGQALLRQIDNILDVVRLEAGGIELARDVIEVPRLLDAAVRQAKTAAQSAHVRLEARPAPDGRWLRGDERRLRQVLGHLIANALKFTPHHGSAAVETSVAADGDLLISVRDSGVGIAGAELDNVFEAFPESVDAPRRPPSLGFGLYFCRSILEAHGGQLTLASQPGSGTTVTLRLPRERLIEPVLAPGLLEELR